MNLSLRGRLAFVGLILLATSPLIYALFNDPPSSTNPIEVLEVVDESRVHLPKGISTTQADLLVYAFNIAKEHGHKDPSVLQGIIWQESHAGAYPGYEVAGHEAGLKFGKRYYGIGQIKLAAAQDVFKRFPKEFADVKDKMEEEIIARLILDDEFNIRVASRYLWMVGRNEQANYERTTNFMITAYNQGVGGAHKVDHNSWHYTVAVNKHKSTFLREFNTMNLAMLD